jgi:hypothetical protein
MGIHKHVFEDVPSWPTDANPRAVVGGNNPPLAERIASEFREALLSEKPDFLTLLEALSGAVERASCNSEDQLARCGQLVITLRAATAHVDAAHKIVKAPYLEQGRLADAEKSLLTERLGAERERVEALQADFLRAHPGTDTIRDHGVTVSVTTEYRSVVQDYALAFAEVQLDGKVREAIDAAVQRTAKATRGKPIPGVTITTHVKVANR